MNVVNIHPVGFEDRPHGHHPCLFKALEPYLQARGHNLLPPASIQYADVVNFDMSEWYLEDRTLSPYDWSVLDVILAKQIPVAFHDAFDHHGWDAYACPWPGKNDWEDMLKIQDHDYARFAYAASRACPILYFMRKMQMLGQEYPDWVLPLEYPLFDDFPLATKEELCARPYDVCFVANLSWPRCLATVGLFRDGRLKFDGEIVFRRIDHFEWMDRHRQAKMFMEADCSMGSERPQRLMTVAPMLRVKSDHRLPFPREDMVHQVEVGDYEGNIKRQDVDKILSVVNNPDLLYSIYVNGAEHMRKYYSIEARSNYVIDHLEKFVGVV